MHDSEDRDIATLLRLKKYEQPPPAYFDNFLHEFHRRQRDELLRQPLWRICLERAHDFMFKLNVPSLTSYPAAATALLAFAAVISLKLYQTPSEKSNLAANRPVLSAPATTDNEWTLASPVSSTRLFSTKPLRSNSLLPTHRATQPRYVLDSVPVSYESTVRF